MTLLQRFFNLLSERKTTPSPTAGSVGYSLLNEITQPINSISLAGARISTDSFFTMWRNNGDVFACVRELYQNVGSAGITFLNKNNSSKDPDQDEVKIATAIFANPKKFRELKKELIKDVEVTGNAYFLIVKSAGDGKVIGLQNIDPRTITVVTDKYGNIQRWIQRVQSETQEYKPEEVLHFKRIKDPNSPVFGLSPLEPIVWEIRTDLSAVVSNYAFFQNDAQPAAHYIIDENLSDAQMNSVVDMIRRQLQGSENRHKSLIMKGIKEVKQLSISQKDMEFSVLRKFTTEKVCATYGVPKAILNYTDGVNYSNGENQDKKFWEGTIEPLEDEIEEFFNSVVFPAIGLNNIQIEFKERKFENKESNETSSRADLQLGILTINEVREMRGYEVFDPNECGEWVDKPIIYGGMGVKPVEDIGLDVQLDVPAIMDEQSAAKALKMIDKTAERYLYGNTNTSKNSKS